MQMQMVTNGWSNLELLQVVVENESTINTSKHFI